jgi:uncharacterized membrane protein YjjP (DUF1212 family)
MTNEVLIAVGFVCAFFKLIWDTGSWKVLKPNEEEEDDVCV